MIAVYGATGYTGQQIARALVGRGHPVILAGRTRNGLENLAGQLGELASVHIAAIEDQHALTTLATEASIIVNCVGPFIRTCRPIAQAAIAGHAHYLDISAEQPALRWCYEEGDALARAAGVALLPSFGFYSTIADLLAERACAGLEPVTEIEVAYWVDHWRPIGTSLLARFDSMGQEWFEHDHGTTVARQGFPRTTVFKFPPPIGRRRLILYPVTDVLTIPRHIDVQRVTSRHTASTLGPRSLGLFLPATANAAGALMRTAARPLVERALAAMWRGRSTGIAESDPTRFMVAVQTRGKTGEAQTWLAGRAIYDITAPIAVEAAVHTCQQSFREVGALAPAQVLDLERLVSALNGFDLKYGAPARTR